MDGIAVAYSELPLELIEQFHLARRMHERGGEREIRFCRQVPNAILPVMHDGQMRVVAWGSRSGKMPRTGYTWLTSVQDGEWAAYCAEEVIIPATAAVQNGIWFPVRSGIRGMLAQAGSEEAVYMIIEPATYYFKIMTRSERMPCLIGERI